MKKLTFSDHGKLALCAFGLGMGLIGALAGRPYTSAEIISVMACCVVQGFLIRSIVVK